MPEKPKKNRKTAKRIVMSILAVLSMGAAATPVLAATKIIEVDTGAAAIIATFAILLLSIIFEVWRFTSQHEVPNAFARAANRRQGFHE